MTHDPGFLHRLRARGEEVLTQVSAELGANPRFARAVASAMRGRELLEQAVARGLREMNLPSRAELKRALARIDALERELAALKGRARGKPRPARRTPRAARGGKA